MPFLEFELNEKHILYSFRKLLFFKIGFNLYDLFFLLFFMVADI